MIVFNLSNRYLDLVPVVGALAHDGGLVCRVRADVNVSREEKRQGKQPSLWAVLARHEEDLGEIAHDPRWRLPRFRPDADVWTDDFSNLVAAFRPFSNFSMPERIQR